MVGEEENKDLYHAYLLSKAVPRKSNRAKWKEESGYAPNMLVEQMNDWKLYKGDMVFASSLDGNILKLIVQKDSSFQDATTLIPVADVENKLKLSVKVDSLLKDGGFIAVVPSGLFSVEGNEIVLTDLAHEQIMNLQPNNTQLYEDHELAELQGIDEITPETDNGDVPNEWIIRVTGNNEVQEMMDNIDIDFVSAAGDSSAVNDEGSVRKRIASDDEEDDLSRKISVKKRNLTNKKSKRKQISDDDDEEDEPILRVDQLKPGDWIVSRYELQVRSKRSINFYLGQLLPNLCGDDDADADDADINPTKQGHDEVRVQCYRSQVMNEHIYIYNAS